MVTGARERAVGVRDHLILAAGCKLERNLRIDLAGADVIERRGNSTDDQAGPAHTLRQRDGARDRTGGRQTRPVNLHDGAGRQRCADLRIEDMESPVRRQNGRGIRNHLAGDLQMGRGEAGRAGERVNRNLWARRPRRPRSRIETRGAVNRRQRKGRIAIGKSGDDLSARNRVSAIVEQQNLQRRGPGGGGGEVVHQAGLRRRESFRRASAGQGRSREGGAGIRNCGAGPESGFSTIKVTFTVGAAALVNEKLTPP